MQITLYCAAVTVLGLAQFKEGLPPYDLTSKVGRKLSVAVGTILNLTTEEIRKKLNK